MHSLEARQRSRSGGGCVSVGSIVLLEQCRQHPGHVPGASYPSRTGCCHHHRWSDRHRSPSKLWTGVPLFTFFTFSVLQSLEKNERPLVLLVNNFFRGGRFSEERTKVDTQPFNEVCRAFGRKEGKNEIVCGTLAHILEISKFCDSCHLY